MHENLAFGGLSSPADVPALSSRIQKLHALLHQASAASAARSNGAGDLLRQAVNVCLECEMDVRALEGRLANLTKEVRDLENRLDDTTERYNLAYENSPFAMSIATVAEGRFRDVNQTFLERLGYTCEEVIGRTSTELGLFPEPGGRRILVETLKRDGHIDGLELPVRSKNGEVRRARMYARIIVYQGEPCILSVSQSLEEIVLAEQEATRLHQFYEQLLRDLPAEIAIYDHSGRYLYVSPSTVRDPQLRQWVLSRTDHNYCARIGLDVSIAERRAGGIASAISNREMISQEERIVTASGEQRYFIRTFTPILGSSGEVVQVIAYGHDITAYKVLEEQLRHAQKMEAIARLAGGVAHDFNNMLTAMMGITDYILPQANGNAMLEAGISEMQRVAERAADLTRQLLAFSRRQPTRNVPVEVSKVIESLGAMLRRIIGETVSLRLFVDPNVPCFMGDPSQLEQIIMNLAINARDAMPNGGTLTIKTDLIRSHHGEQTDHPLPHPGEYVRIVVQDTGFGMDADTKKRIFEPFFTTKAEGKGTGLGLPTVYAIVERWSGKVYVDSELGKGTTFSIYLPCVVAPSERKDSVKTAIAEARGTETILVAEDEDAVRNVVSRVLQRCGYTVLEASSGEEALTLAEHYTGPIHMLISDMVMAGMSGRELAEKLRRHRPEMVMFFMSGHCDENDAKFVNQLERSDFIQKPFSASTLAACVRELLDTHR